MDLHLNPRQSSSLQFIPYLQNDDFPNQVPSAQAPSGFLGTPTSTSLAHPQGTIGGQLLAEPHFS